MKNYFKSGIFRVNNMKILLLVILCFFCLEFFRAWRCKASPAYKTHEIVSVKKIWDQGEHNAFTDLLRFRERWFCTFREAVGHVRGDGKIRVIVSRDGEQWESTALLSEEGIDLRDPKISVTADGWLMILAGGSVYREEKLVERQPRVAFSKDGYTWTPTQRILQEGEWLWRVTWQDGKGFGVSYKAASEKKGDWSVNLYITRDGINYEHICEWDIPGKANETTLRLQKNGDMMALVRREGGDQCGWIGTSSPPYEEWKWHETKHRLGGPNFLILPDRSMWAASRSYLEDGYRTVLAELGPKTYNPVLTMPSGGDCSYPGLVWFDDHLWMSYYSSHEGKTSIYLAKIKIDL